MTSITKQKILGGNVYNVTTKDGKNITSVDYLYNRIDTLHKKYGTNFMDYVFNDIDDQEYNDKTDDGLIKMLIDQSDMTSIFVNLVRKLYNEIAKNIPDAMPFCALQPSVCLRNIVSLLDDETKNRLFSFDVPSKPEINLETIDTLCINGSDCMYTKLYQMKDYLYECETYYMKLCDHIQQLIDEYSVLESA